jgi:SAM-dependent methyltransferase
MFAANNLKDVLATDRSVTIVEDDIYSVLSDPLMQHHYDRRAAVYDAVANSPLYGRVAWGSLPNDYVSFARESTASSPEGRFLDAGCGSLIFTAPSYLESSRQIIAFDESLSMLRRARKRLLKLAGAVPEYIALLQGDLADLPFQPKSFQSVLCMNVLHHIEEAGTLIENLKALLSDGGHLHLTSLVYNHRFVGDLYLKALHSSGEFARPRSSLGLRKILGQALGEKVVYRVKGNMAFASCYLSCEKTSKVGTR